MFLAVAALLLVLQSRDKNPGFEWTDPSQAANRSLQRGLATFCPSLKAGAAVLLRGDPFDADVYDPMFVARLWYHDPAILVDRTKTPSAARETTAYDCVLEYRGSQFLGVAD